VDPWQTATNIQVYERCLVTRRVENLLHAALERSREHSRGVVLEERRKVTGRRCVCRVAAGCTGYDFGHAYWDRCGRIINEIIATHESWNFENMGAGACLYADLKGRGLVERRWALGFWAAVGQVFPSACEQSESLGVVLSQVSHAWLLDLKRSGTGKNRSLAN
jgi:hypothetical protein